MGVGQEQRMYEQLRAAAGCVLLDKERPIAHESRYLGLETAEDLCELLARWQAPRKPVPHS
jgi:hypothetical protein